MNTLHETSNKDILKELSKRLKKGEIKFEGNRITTKLVEGDGEKDGVYFGILLKLNIGDMVNAIIEELKSDLQFVREDKKKLEEELSKFRND